MSLKLLGLAAPYGVPGAYEGRSGLRRVLDPFAVTTELLDHQRQCDIQINHDNRAVQGASVRWLNSHVGLFALIDVPDGLVARDLSRRRAEWRGLSISYYRSTTTVVADWQTMTATITKVGFIDELSIIMGDHEPLWAETWLMERGPEATTRMRREARAAMEAASWPGSNIGLPAQSSALEANIEASDPLRRLNRPMPGRLDPDGFAC